MNFSIDQMLQLAPKADRVRLVPILTILDLLFWEDIKDAKGIAAFTALLIIDSNQFRKDQENLDLNADQMDKIQFRQMFRFAGKNFYHKDEVDQFFIDYTHQPEKLGNFLFDKQFGNGENEGYLYRPAFWSRMIGKAEIEAHREYTIEFETNHPLPIPKSGELPIDQFCAHPLPNVLSVYRKWRREDIKRLAFAGRYADIVKRFCEYPDQVRKYLDLVNHILKLQKSESSNKV